MIALTKFQEAQRLLAVGNLSHRKIAALVGISRGTVGEIASGKYRDRLERERARLSRDDFQPLGPLERCPGCGGMVLMPCLSCRVQREKEQEQQVLRSRRRRAREDKLRQLLHAVRKANWARDAREGQRHGNRYLPAAADFSDPSDCR